MLLISPEIERLINRDKYTGGVCVVENPRILFFEIHNFLAENFEYRRKEFDTTIGTGSVISPLSAISTKNVCIGKNVVIEEFAVIRENTTIGDGSIIRSGVKIGGQGFEFKRKDGKIMHVKHLGGVVIGSDVEIQYNACIDCAVYPWDDTVIGNYTKIDNLVHIGHAVKIEDNVMIVAQSGVGGRTVINNNTWLGFSSTVSNGLEIGKNSRVNIGSVVTKNVMDNESVTGNFAIRHDKFIENLKKSIIEVKE